MHGQPTNQDLDIFEDELLWIASSIYSELVGGSHGHASLLLSEADYEEMVPGTPFVFPMNPGIYPMGIIPAAQQSQWEAEHKALV